MEAYVRKSRFQDALELAPKLREEDKQEIHASKGIHPEIALGIGVTYSDVPLSICIKETDEVIGMFGVVGEEQDGLKVGAIWMLASPKLMDFKMRFIRESRRWIESIEKSYDLLYNVVDERNTVHIRWIKWCGFTVFKRHEKYGYGQLPFLEFVKIIDKEDNHVHS